MNLLDKLSNILPLPKKNHHQEYYFALNIGNHKVSASVWGITGHKLHILSASEAEYADQSHLVESANIALDEALGDLTFDPEKILFGVPDAWLQDDDLKEEYLKVLRHMVKELGLTPMAYVSTTQAISHFLQKQQGVPLTAILVQVGHPLQVTVVKGGKLIGTKSQRHSENLPEDIEKALHTFTEIEVLPSKILIYGAEKEDKLKEELQGYSWMNQLPFLHLPKVDSLDHDIITKSVCLAGASEITPNVTFHNLHVPKAEPNSHHSRRSMLIDEEGEESVGHPAKVPVLDNDLNAGFVAGDIADESHHNLERDLESEDVSSVEYPENDLSEKSLTTPSHSELSSRHTNEGSLIQKMTAIVTSPFQGLQRQTSEEPHHRAKNLGFNLLSNMMVIIPVILLLLLGAGYIFLPKAKVTVFIDLRILEKDSQIVADPTATAVDETNKIIPGKIVETSVTGSKVGNATGKKKVGDPAKGKVVIFNRTDSPKTFNSGTVLIGPNNLKYTLDTQVKVASQSSTTGADFSTIIQPGKSESVSATASDIGPDGNIAAGTELEITGNAKAQVVAKVDSAFSGGVSKDVTVVTADDQKKLLAALTAELRQKAKEDLQGKLTGDAKVLEEGLQEKITKSTYSKKVNDQANQFSLDLTATYSGTSYSETDLRSIVSKLVETNVPAGYQLDLSKTETQADVSKIEKDGKLIFLAKFRAKLMPKLTEAQIKKDLLGKTTGEAEDYLKKIENVIGSDIELTPNLPPPVQRLPLLEQNITLEVTAK